MSSVFAERMDTTAPLSKDATASFDVPGSFLTFNALAVTVPTLGKLPATTFSTVSVSDVCVGTGVTVGVGVAVGAANAR